MALGYCKVCDKLVPIVPGGFRLGTRERVWYPVAHDAPDGKRCDSGPKKGI